MREDLYFGDPLPAIHWPMDCIEERQLQLTNNKQQKITQQKHCTQTENKFYSSRLHSVSSPEILWFGSIFSPARANRKPVFQLPNAGPLCARCWAAGSPTLLSMFFMFCFVLFCFVLVLFNRFHTSDARALRSRCTRSREQERCAEWIKAPQTPLLGASTFSRYLASPLFMTCGTTEPDNLSTTVLIK